MSQDSGSGHTGLVPGAEASRYFRYAWSADDLASMGRQGGSPGYRKHMKDHQLFDSFNPFLEPAEVALFHGLF